MEQGGRPLDGGHPRADHGGTEQGDSALYRQCARRPRSSSPSHVSNQTGISTIARLVHPPPIAAADSIGYVQPGVTVLTRRRLIALSAGIALAPDLFGRSACAQMQPLEWPNRVVRLIVPFAAGGPTDIVARIVAEQLSKIWGQQVVRTPHRPNRSWSSLPTQGPIRARSHWHPLAPAARRIWPASCSSKWPRSTWRTFPIAARRRPSTISFPVG